MMDRRKILKWLSVISFNIIGGWILNIFELFESNSLWGKVGSRVFYVDAIHGDDRNSGTSRAEAWRSISKVNSISYQAGDQVLLRRGQEFNSGFLKPMSGGINRLPVMFAAYGVGERPIITNSLKLNTFRLFEENIWRARLGSQFRKGFEIQIVRHTKSREMYRGRRHAVTQLKQAGDFFHDRRNAILYIFSIHDPSGYIEVPKGHKYDALLTMNHPWLVFQDLQFDFSNQFCVQVRASHQIIQNCIISNGADGGLHTVGRQVDDCLFEKNEVYGCGGSGIMVNGPKVTRNNWTIRENHVHHNCLDFISGRKGMHNYTAGIKVFCLGDGKGLLIERNIVHHNGNVHQNNPALIKGVGIWVDTWPNSGANVRYNRVYQNVYSGIKIELTEKQLVYCNIVTNNGLGREKTNRNTGRGGILCSRGAHANLICHNTIIDNFGPQIGLQGPLTDVGGRNTKFSNHNIIKNNIAYSFDGKGEALQVFGWKVGDFNRNILSHNCFGPPRKSFIVWGTQPEPQSFQTYEVFEDMYVKQAKHSSTFSIRHIPDFVDNRQSDFHLVPNSYLKNKGQHIPEVAYDFDNVRFNSSPSVGAYQ